MKIIGFGHRKRVGKTLAGKFVSSLFKNSILRGFADKLKQQCHELYSWAGLESAEYYERHPILKESILPLIGKSPRQIYIEHGQAAKSVYPDVWIDCLLKGVSADILIIPDVRFPKEIEKIKELGGIVIKIENPRIEPSHDEADDSLLDFNNWDYVIVNDGDKNDFFLKLTFIQNLN